ncbi:MAG: hypothetical protein QM708_15045 [Propioniciclava sp.]|uniref:hypothetical protein n=1 Tax=Propioniciclava sp. TaxID=2038686 RepID=UPI0039E367DD
MAVMIFTMIVVMVLAVGVIAVVTMGLEGAGSRQHPEIADAMAKTARHLNGEGAPPRALVALVDEIDEVPDMRELPRRLRSSLSARSARSAASSASAPDGDDWPVVLSSAARAMEDALEADPVDDPSEDDPYGVWGAADTRA